MAFVIAAPEALVAASTDLTAIGSAIGEANSAAATRATTVLAAGADDVSAVITALFGAHARSYQALGAQAAAPAARAGCCWVWAAPAEPAGQG